VLFISATKVATVREATAQCIIELPQETLEALGVGEGPMHDTSTLASKKGPVVSTAIIAGVMAAKRTSDTLPFCHPLPLEAVDVDISWLSRSELCVQCSVRVTHATGVEMEALTGASVAALCVYDMLKASSHDIIIKDLRLMSKSGGKRRYERVGADSEHPGK